MEMKKIFRVGGFVRDTLLGLNPHDIDYVVIDESPDSMLARGFTQVGHFPVFLHPETQDEYALARSEVSNGDGHKDFLYDWKGVTLEQDLMRRDLTINAMAMTDSGSIVDPYGGQDDLKKGVLRHVSDSFAEDPLRVLRVARFAARYGFAVANETEALMRQMVDKGMLDTLTRERIWQETEKALLTTCPSKYFEVLAECGALTVVFPELQKMIGVPQRADYHAEGDVWVHTMMVIDEAAALSKTLCERSRVRILAGALLHDLGKTVTPHELLWDEDGSVRGQHHGHEDPERFGPLLNSFAERVRLPMDVKHFAWVCALVHQDIHRVKDMSGKGLVNLYEKLGLERMRRYDPAFLADVLMMCRADNQGRLTRMPDGRLKQPTHYHQAEYVTGAMDEIQKLRPGTVIQAEMAKGQTLEEAKNRLRGQQRRLANNYKSASLDC